MTGPADANTERKLVELYLQKRNEARDPTEKTRLTQQILNAEGDVKLAETARPEQLGESETLVGKLRRLLS